MAIPNTRRQNTIGIFFENIKIVITIKTNSNNNKVNSLALLHRISYEDFRIYDYRKITTTFSQILYYEELIII